MVPNINEFSLPCEAAQEQADNDWNRQGSKALKKGRRDDHFGLWMLTMSSQKRSGCTSELFGIESFWNTETHVGGIPRKSERT